MPVKVSVAGWARCEYFQKAGNVAASLEHLFPDRFHVEMVQLDDRAAFVAWLPKVRERLGGDAAMQHSSSPIVWLNDSEYVGGADDLIEWARAQMGGGGPFRTVGGTKIAPDLDAQGKDFDYDLVVIGGGSGGLSCAKAAAELGASVALLDFVSPSPQGTSWGLGGTCVNVGCIPKKLFHHAALSGEFVEDAAEFGWKVPPLKEVSHDWEKLVNGVRNYIKSLNFGYRVQLREKKVKYLNKLGSLVDTHTVKCVDKKGKEELITAACVLLAVGGRPKQLDCPGGELAITSDDMFYLAKSPGKTLVVGASYVALECASFLAGFGLDTTVMVRSILLRGFDQQMAEKVGAAMEKRGTKFIHGAVPRKLVKTSDGRIKVHWDDGEDVFDTVLAAVGRSADVARLGLDTAGLEVNASGKLDTTHMQTANPSIFAIGDCVQGVPELTPVAIELGRNLARRLFGTETVPVNMHFVPTAVFAGLEYGCVGVSEEEAVAKLGEDGIEVYHTHFTPLQWTVPENREYNECYCKVIIDKKTELVLGIHLLSPEAGEVVQAYGVPMKMGMAWSDLEGLIGIHPTIGEELCLLDKKKSDGGEAVKSGC